jgi:hypothetical protein
MLTITNSVLYIYIYIYTHIYVCLESGRFIHYWLAGPDIASPEPQLAVFFQGS